MGTTFRFLSSPREAPAVLDWFGQLPDPPTHYPKPAGTLLRICVLVPGDHLLQGCLIPDNRIA